MCIVPLPVPRIVTIDVHMLNICMMRWCRRNARIPKYILCRSDEEEEELIQR